MVKLVVKVPHPKMNSPQIILPTVPAGADATPYFESAFALARTIGASIIVVPKSTYTFLSLSEDSHSHITLNDLNDLTISGNGSTLVFTKAKTGIAINSSHRLKLKHLNIEYNLHMASLAKTRSHDGKIEMVVDDAYPLAQNDEMYVASEFDPVKRVYVPDTSRRIIPPGSLNRPMQIASQIYSSEAFKGLLPDKTFMLFHNWYEGYAIGIEDIPGPKQTEDIVLDGINIHSAPGMGIVAHGLKRGLAILHSAVEINPHSKNPMSVEWDAIHIREGSDILIMGNHLANQGDDAINLNMPVNSIVSIDRTLNTIILKTHLGFISEGDYLAFFDAGGQYLGQSKVVRSPIALDALNHAFVMEHIPSMLDTAGVIRDINLIGSRFEISKNIIENCNCHGVLAQLPNGIIKSNIFRHLRRNAIKLLTSLIWNEGTGSFNTIIYNNNISDTGSDDPSDIPLAAIVAYGHIQKGSQDPVNGSLIISNNTISHAHQGCITISNSAGVKVSGNKCISTNLNALDTNSLNVMYSKNILLKDNLRQGITTGSIGIDSASTENILVQLKY